jgi:hypothetical protein
MTTDAEPRTPTDEDLELIVKLAHEQLTQARGTTASERTWIAAAAAVIERLASGAGEDFDRAEGRRLLSESH